MDQIKILMLKTLTDARGTLTIAENALPFEARRTFWITSADGQTRGGHRHHSNRQGLIAMTGTIDVFMDDGVKQETVVLNSPSQCLIVEPNHWHTMHFGAGSALLVFASHGYDVADYIDERYTHALNHD